MGRQGLLSVNLGLDTRLSCHQIIERVFRVRLNKLRRSRDRRHLVAELLKFGMQVMVIVFRQKMEEVQRLIKEKTEAGLAKILIPAQRERLEEIQTQISLRSAGVSALSSSRLAELLGLTDEQKKDLIESQSDYQKKLQKGIEDLKTKLQQEILKEVLSTEQIAQLEKLKGERFDVKRTSFRERIEALRKQAKEKSEEKKDK